MRHQAVIFGLMLIWSSGCEALRGEEIGATAPSETSEVIETPTIDILTATPELTSEPMQTRTPYNETFIPPTPSPTETPARPTLSTEGPWLVFAGHRRGIKTNLLFVLDAATNQVHQITNDGRVYWRFFISNADPRRSEIALMQERGEGEIWLEFLRLPEATLTPVVNLIPNKDPNGRELNGLGNAAGGVWHGNKLAFIGAMDPPSTDVYVYRDGLIQPISHETEMLPRWVDWSPEGDYVLYGVIEYFGEDVCQGNQIIYAVGLSDGSSITLTPEQNMKAVIVSWVDAHTVLIASRTNHSCQWSELYEVDITTGERRTWWDSKFSVAAYDPESGALVMTLGFSQFYAQYNPAQETPGDAIFFKDGQSRALGLSVYDQVYWSGTHQLFVLRSDTDLISVTASGELNTLPSPDGWAPHFPSPDGRWVLWTEQNQKKTIGLWGEEPQILLDGEIYIWIWRPDSSGLYYWTSRGLFYAAAPRFQAQRIDDVSYDGPPLHWIMP